VKAIKLGKIKPLIECLNAKANDNPETTTLNMPPQRPTKTIVIIGTGAMGLACARRLAPAHHLILADYSITVLETASQQCKKQATKSQPKSSISPSHPFKPSPQQPEKKATSKP
jgi:threonine dehydrogenase-like Zn-dependent dehydrogenase